MKKLLLFTFSLISANCLLAQSYFITDVIPVDLSVPKNVHQDVMTTYTLTPYFDRASKDVILRVGSTGYDFGTSSATSETAVHFDGVGNATITHILVYIGVKKVIGAGDDLTFKTYAAGPDSMPSTLAASGTQNVSALKINSPNFIPMTNQLSNVSGDFLVAVEYGSADDSICIISSNPTTQFGGPDGKGEKRTKQYTKTNPQWARAWDLWSNVPPPAPHDPCDADAYIMPVLDTPTGVDSPIETADFQLFKPFPTPAADYTNLSYSLKKDGPINVVVFDQEGKIMGEFHSENNPAGKNQLKIDLTQYASGNYFYRISGASSSIMSKFTVVK